jgi:glucose/mannose-6-phosphate isomerase
MNLDDYQQFSNLDASNMIEEIDNLPDQLHLAWELGHTNPLSGFGEIRQVLVAGMGGSAIGADLLAAYLEPIGRVPLLVQRDYSLPKWAMNPNTLVIASSHSGNTEETLSVFREAQENGCQIMGISTGGILLEECQNKGIQTWAFQHGGQPRAAVGYSFGLLLALFNRLGLVADPRQELEEAIAVMRNLQENVRIDIPVVKNPAKRLAGQMVGRWITVVGSGILSPVARRWKGQISELAKTWGQFEALPEMDHNSLAGTEFPAEILANLFVLFLQANADHPRNQLRSEMTRQTMMLAGIGTDTLHARGESRFAQLWSALLFGDYCAYYLAMAYAVDPTPIPAIMTLKQALQS